MKKILLSLLVAFGAVSGLNAASGMENVETPVYGERLVRQVRRKVANPYASTAQETYTGSYAQKWKQYRKEMAAYRKELAAWRKKQRQTDRWGSTNRLKPNVDKDTGQRMCKLMNNPKNFKSINGMNHAYNCRCLDGVLTCDTTHEVYSSVDTNKKRKNVSINFNDPKHHPVIMVNKAGGLDVMPLKRFEMEKAYQEKYGQPKHQLEEKIYIGG